MIWHLADGEPLADWIDADSLTAEERSRAESIAHPRVKTQFLRGRLLTRAVLGLRLGLSATAVPLLLSADGKPEIHGNPVFFNISHTDGMLVLAVGPCPLGVDIQAEDPRRDRDALVDRYFNDAERRQYHALPAELRPAAFLRGWTSKEAWVKATGAGIRDFNRCTVDMDPRRSPAILTESGGWRLFGWNVGAGVAGVLALSLPASERVNIATDRYF